MAAPGRRFVVDTFGSNFDTVLTVFRSGAGGTEEVACNDDAAIVNGESISLATYEAQLQTALASYAAQPGIDPKSAEGQAAPAVTSASPDSWPPDSDIAEVWRRVRESFGHRPVVAAALDHAEVVSWESGTVTLQFVQRFALDQTAKFKSEIERCLTKLTGTTTRVDLKMASSQGPALLRSEVGREADAAQIDQNQRETEARQHPMIRKAQELFGVSPKEIKIR